MKTKTKTSPKTLTIKLYRSPVNGQWYFSVRSANGKIVAQSEGYTRRENAMKTATLLATAVFTVVEEGQ
jgi:uncharacterized protein YegP (UPF0339 family)